MRLIAFVFIVQIFSLSAVLCAAPFVNLTFDEANVDRVVPLDGSVGFFSGSPGDLLPGWNYIYDEHPATVIYYSLRYESGLGMTLSPDFRFNSLAMPPENSRYILSISASKAWDHNDPLTGIPAAALSISQHGEVPLGASELRFDSNVHSDSGFRIPVEVRLNGQDQSLQLLGNDRGFDQFVVDVSGFAGKEVDLEIKFTPGVFGFFDISGFTQIPEPSTWTLLLTGVGGLFWYSRRT